MKTTRLNVLFLGFLSLLWSCALIDGHPTLIVNLDEKPKTKVTILDAKGAIVHEAITPTHVIMDDAYLQRSDYSIVFHTGAKERSFRFQASRSGAYYEDLPNLQPMAVLVLNANTGALFQINREAIDANLSVANAPDRKNDFEVYTLDQIPGEWKSYLYPLN